MHHGTLLFSADISDMAGALRVNGEKLKSKGIKSVPSRVRNIKDIEGYTGPGTAEEFAGRLIEFAERRFGIAARGFTPEENAAVEKLRDEKYSLWEWNFGSSPEYGRKTARRFPFGTVEVSFETGHGVINEIKAGGDFFGVRDIAELEEKLRGVRLEKAALTEVLADVGKYISGASPEDIRDLFIGD